MHNHSHRLGEVCDFVVKNRQTQTAMYLKRSCKLRLAFWTSILLSSSGATVNASGLLATLTVDTTGIMDGTYDLRLSSTQIGQDSDFVFPGGGSLLSKAKGLAIERTAAGRFNFASRIAVIGRCTSRHVTATYRCGYRRCHRRRCGDRIGSTCR